LFFKENFVAKFGLNARLRKAKFLLFFFVKKIALSDQLNPIRLITTS
jgi:hypothetical protein